MAQDIAVLAGNGKSGRRVAAALRVAGHRVRAAGRRGPVRFDWHDDTTWSGVVDGADALYLVAFDAEVAPFVAHALDAGVARIALISGRGLEHYTGRFGSAMVAAEDAVAASGRGTILRASNFAQNFTEDMFASGVRSGRLALPAENVADAFVDLGDVAAVAARVLTEPGHEGRTYELTGPDALTFEQAVDVIAASTGRDLRYQALAPEDFAAELRGTGAAEADVAELLGMFEIMSEGHLGGTRTDVAELLGRPARSFADWAVEAAAHGAWN